MRRVKKLHADSAPRYPPSLTNPAPAVKRSIPIARQHYADNLGAIQHGAVTWMYCL